MAPLPRTRAGLEAVGYKYSTKGKCKKCPAEVQWFVTPSGAWMPFDMPDENGDFDNHWATCPAREAFKRKKETK